MTSRKEEYRNAIDTISRLITGHLNSASSESQAPGKTPDESDHFIRTHKQVVVQLRSIRETLENIESTKDYLEP